MFFIVNKTNQTITLGDIKITLGPRQAVDLDRMMERRLSEKSVHLQAAKRRGHIEIRIKDEDKKVEKVAYIESSKGNLDSLKSDILNELKGSLKDLKDDLKRDSGGLTKEDFTQIVQSVIEATVPREKETIIIKEGAGFVRDDVEVEINEDVAIDINARAVTKIVKDTEIKSMHYKEEELESSILSNVDELSDLLD